MSVSDPEQQEGVWVHTHLNSKENGYVVHITANGKKRLQLKPDSAMAYAKVVLWAAVYAEYDAMVFRQMMAVSNDEAATVGLLRAMQSDRPPFDTRPTTPFQFLPGLTRESRKPAIQCKLDDELLGTWEPNDARNHAFHVIEAVFAADLDSAYLRALVGQFGLDKAQATNVVGHLTEHA